MGIRTERPTPALAQLSMNLHHHRFYSLLFLLLLLLVPPAKSQSSPPRVDPYTRITFNKTMAAVLIILVVVFFALGFVSIYTRQCAERRIRGRLDLAVAIAGGMESRQQQGLDPEIIDTFPTFVYSEVKSLKIGRTTLECAVCLNEFKDDETLRLIPQCCHVFHPECIDAWLVNHSTCPVCRANLAPPEPDDVDAPSNVMIQIPDPVQPNRPNTELDCEPNHINPVDEEIQRVTPPEVPVRSTSTGFGIAKLFPRSHSTGQDFERFTLRLPEEVRNQLVSNGSLNRTKSCGVTWQRQSSERKGYRTRSVGRNYLPYERFNGEGRLDRWGFMWTPPFWGRNGSTRSTKGTRLKDEVDVEERSTDHLVSKK